MNNNIPQIKRPCVTIGELPSSYLQSMSYEEQLIMLFRKVEEIISWANNQLSHEIKNYIEQNFNDMMINSMYESETETLILYLDRSDD